MAVTVQMQFESAVTEMYQDAFVGSAIENGTTIITLLGGLLPTKAREEYKIKKWN
jgi:hypothetical protein